MSASTGSRVISSTSGFSDPIDFLLGIYRHHRRPLWGETDSAQIVYTVRFTDYVMEAIEGWFIEVLGTGWYELNMDTGVGTPFVRLEMDIHKPLTPRDELIMPVLIEKLGNASITFRVQGRVEPDTISFDARFVCCMADHRTMKARRIPDNMRQVILDYMDSCENLDAN